MASISGDQLAAKIESKIKKLKPDWQIRVSSSYQLEGEQGPLNPMRNSMITLNAVARPTRSAPDSDLAGMGYCVDLAIFESLRGTPKDVDMIDLITRRFLDYIDAMFQSRGYSSEQSSQIPSPKGLSL